MKKLAIVIYTWHVAVPYGNIMIFKKKTCKGVWKVHIYILNLTKMKY